MYRIKFVNNDNFVHAGAAGLSIQTGNFLAANKPAGGTDISEDKS